MSRIFIHSAVGLEISKSIFWPVVVISVWSFVRCEILALRASVLLYGGGEDWMQWCTLSSRLRVDNLSTVASMFSHFISFFSAFLSSWIFCGYQNADTWLRVCRCNEAPSLSNWLKISGFFFFAFNFKGTKLKEGFIKEMDFFHSLHTSETTLYFHKSSLPSGFYSFPYNRSESLNPTSGFGLLLSNRSLQCKFGYFPSFVYV